MADIPFTKPTNANNAPPALSAANIQARDDALDAVVHKANRGAALLRADLLNETTDGIGGQPPDARSRIDAGKGVGAELSGTASSGAALYYSGSTNETGTWKIMIFKSVAGVLQNVIGVAIGSGTYSASLTFDVAWFAKRIAT